MTDNIQRYRQTAGENNDTMKPDPIGAWVLHSEVQMHADRIFVKSIKEMEQDHIKAMESLENALDAEKQMSKDLFNEVQAQAKEIERFRAKYFRLAKLNEKKNKAIKELTK
jgi:septal ring factor EnvC (AmiA/AmiB activator)